MIAVLAFALCPLLAQADDEDDIAKLQALDSRCEEARAIALAPIRAQLVEKCVNEERRPRGECQVEISDYGNGFRSQSTGGGTINRLFDDLPACVLAKEAWLRREQGLSQ
ncbi:MAG TPA: hypothetical protein VFF74_07120 [Methylophilaceae bacterium]|nr:hypothetical protein [Methylophilaceae bacterium]